jgi:hypothetical protein
MRREEKSSTGSTPETHRKADPPHIALTSFELFSKRRGKLSKTEQRRNFPQGEPRNEVAAQFSGLL